MAATTFGIVGDFGKANDVSAQAASGISAGGAEYVVSMGDQVYIPYETWYYEGDLQTWTSAAPGSFHWYDAAVGDLYGDYIDFSQATGSRYAGQNAGDMRFFPVLGNHDWYKQITRELVGGTYYDDDTTTVKDHWVFGYTGSDLYETYFSGLNGLASVKDVGHFRWYDVDQGPIHWVAMSNDTNEAYLHATGAGGGLVTGESSADPDANGPGNAIADQNLGTEQLTWVQESLAGSDLPWKIVFMHAPPYASPTEDGHPSATYSQFDFGAWDVDLVLAGHNHFYERLEVDGVPYVINGSGGAGLDSFDSRYHAGTQARYDDQYGYQLAEVSETLLRLKFHAIDQDAALDDFAISKGGTLADGDLTGLTGLKLSTGGGTLAVAGDVTVTALISGSGGLTKSGGGTVVLDPTGVTAMDNPAGLAANSWTGGTTVAGGTLALGSATAMASATAITVAEGAVFDLVAARDFQVSDLDGDGTVALAGSTLTSTAGAFAGTLSGDGTVSFGGSGGQAVTGAGGSQLLVMGAGGDAALAGDGADTVYGNLDADTLAGGDDADLLYGGQAGDVLSGGGGADTLFGNLAADSLTGGAGADLVGGGAGDDRLQGDGGADTLSGGDGADTLAGGADADGLYGGAGADDLSGGGGADVLRGATGDDSLSGGAGADILEGAQGRDLLVGGGDGDRLLGATDDDVLSGGGGDDLLSAGAGADRVYGNLDADTLSGGADADHLYGGQGADDLWGQTGADMLYGDAGTDDLWGGAGDDFLHGGGDADNLSGGAGSDTLDGGDGSAVMTGGADADLFRIAEDSTRTLITDFDSAAGDLIEVTGISNVTFLIETATSDWSGTLLTVGDDREIQILGLRPDQVSADMFLV